MESVVDILEALESDNSRLYKEELLERHRKNALLHRCFVAAFDPYVNYYVKKFKVGSDPSAQQDDDQAIDSFLQLLSNELAPRRLVGNDAKAALEQFFEELNPRQAKWCQRILLKNLRCGVQETTVNKVWPGSIVKFSCQLAETLGSRFDSGTGIVITEPVSYPVRVEPKLDGLRCIAVKRAGEVTMFTRNGTRLETLPTIKALLEAAPWNNFVLDGEIMGADWNESASVVMSHKRAKDDSGMRFYVFDAMHLHDWLQQQSEFSLADRLRLAHELVHDVASDRVVPVEGQRVLNQTQLLQFYAQTMEQGYEGIMIKDLDANYCFKRSDAVLKLKPTQTHEGVVVGHYEGRLGSKREGLWGGFQVLMPNGVVTRCGGGFTDKQKAEIGLDPDSWIGRVVELEGQPDPMTPDGLTVDGKVRFPVFVRERSPSDVDPRVVAAGETWFEAQRASQAGVY